MPPLSLVVSRVSHDRFASYVFKQTSSAYVQYDRYIQYYMQNSPHSCAAHVFCSLWISARSAKRTLCSMLVAWRTAAAAGCCAATLNASTASDACPTHRYPLSLYTRALHTRTRDRCRGIRIRILAHHTRAHFRFQFFTVLAR